MVDVMMLRTTEVGFVRERVLIHSVSGRASTLPGGYPGVRLSESASANDGIGNKVT